MLEKRTLLGIFDITPRESMWRKIDEQKEAINGLRYTKDENCKQIDALNLKLATAEQAKKDLVKKLDALQGDVAKLEEVNEKLAEDKKLITAANNDLRAKNAQLEGIVAEKNKEIESLKSAPEEVAPAVDTAPEQEQPKPKKNRHKYRGGNGRYSKQPKTEDKTE